MPTDPPELPAVNTPDLASELSAEERFQLELESTNKIFLGESYLA
jgi:hypothetical protein